jgi:hypothetical protein
MSGCSDKVGLSSHFGKEMTLWKSYDKENEVQHLVGLTR